MVKIELTDKEALAVRDLIGKLHKYGPDLGRVYYKLEHALKRPAVKRKWNGPPISRVSIKFGEDDE
jgi:hypothetical protein